MAFLVGVQWCLQSTVFRLLLGKFCSPSETSLPTTSVWCREFSGEPDLSTLELCAAWGTWVRFVDLTWERPTMLLLFDGQNAVTKKRVFVWCARNWFVWSAWAICFQWVVPIKNEKWESELILCVCVCVCVCVCWRGVVEPACNSIGYRNWKLNWVINLCIKTGYSSAT